MKFSKFFFLGLLTVLLLTGSVYGQCNVQDDFSGTTINTSVWNMVSGSWSQNNQLTGYWSISAAQTDQGNILLVDGLQPSGDYTVEVDEVVSPFGQYKNGHQTFVLYHSPGNKYNISFGCENTAFGMEYRQGGSNYHGLVAIYSIPYFNTTPGQANHTKLVRTGNHFQCYLNDHLIHEFDETIFGGDVKIGIGCYGTATYDNFCLTTGDQPPSGKKIFLYTTRATGQGIGVRRIDFDEDLPTILAQDGFSVRVEDRQSLASLDATLLANYDQLWFVTTESSPVLSPAEVQAIQDFHAAGKGIMIIGDGYEYTAPASQFSSGWGVQFNGSVCWDCDHCGGPIGCPISTAGFPTHEIWTNVSQIQANLNEGNLTATPPGQIIATHNGINMVGVSAGSGGRVAWDATVYRFTNASAHPNLAITYYDNARYARNLASWLAGSGQPPQEYVTLSGLITQNGSNMPSVTVTATGNAGTFTDTTRSDGVYEISVPKGQYVITAQKQNEPVLEFHPSYDIGIFTDMDSVNFVEDHLGPEIYDFGYGTFAAEVSNLPKECHKPREDYDFTLTATEANTGQSSIVEVELLCGPKRVEFPVEGGTTVVGPRIVTIPILSLLETGDYCISARAKDRWGHWGEPSTIPLSIAKSNFRPVQDGFHFENYGIGGLCGPMSWAAIAYKIRGYDLNSNPDNNIEGCGGCACQTPPWNSPINLYLCNLFPSGVLAGLLHLYVSSSVIPPMPLGLSVLPYSQAYPLWVTLSWLSPNQHNVNYSNWVLDQFNATKQIIRNGQYPYLALYDPGINAGHAVVAYATVELGQSLRYVHIYDPNYPKGVACKQDDPDHCNVQPTPLSMVKASNENQWTAMYDKYNIFAALSPVVTPLDDYFISWTVSGTPPPIQIAQVAAYSVVQSANTVKKAITTGLSGTLNQLGAWISIHSPVSVMIVDSIGNRLGYEGSVLVNEIPGSEALKVNEAVDFFVPANRGYKVICSATDEGVLHQFVYFPNADSSINVWYFETQVVPGMVTSTRIGTSSGCSSMLIDANGDGTYESTQSPLSCEPHWIIPDTVVTCDASTVPVWYKSWSSYSGAKVRCLIGDLPLGYNASNIVSSSIILNDSVHVLDGLSRIVPQAEGFTGAVLEVSFDARKAMQSLGEVTVGQERVILLSGRLADNNMIFTQATVRIEEGPGYASLSGSVKQDTTKGLLGVNLDIYDSTGTLWQSVVTKDSGYYHVDSIPNGTYSISVVTPLGYQADQETKEFTINHVPVTMNFNLTKLAITPRPRTQAYWAHQLEKALQNRPDDYTKRDFSRFVGLINLHFNQNQVNPVDFYTVTQPANQQDSLMALKRLLNMCQWGEPMPKRMANADLMALMLNVVSGKISQTQIISEDGRTASQAITYCDMLVNGEIDCPDCCPHGHGHGHHNPPDCGPGYGSPHCRYIRADFILDFANLGIRVPEDLIPEDVVQIAYRIQSQESLPKGFALYQNYPNPFNPECEFAYDLPTNCHVTLSIYNVLGQKVRVLVDEYQNASNKTVSWDSKDDQGQEVTSGIYFYRIQAGDFVQSRKMVLMK